MDQKTNGPKREFHIVMSGQFRNLVMLLTLSYKAPVNALTFARVIDSVQCMFLTKMSTN